MTEATQQQQQQQLKGTSMFTETHLTVICNEARPELREYNKMNDKVGKKRDGEKKFSGTCKFLASKDQIDGWAKKKNWEGARVRKIGKPGNI